MPFPYIPRELVDIILEYDGTLRYKNGRYIMNTANPIYTPIKYSLENKIIVLRRFPPEFREISTIEFRENKVEIVFVSPDRGSGVVPDWRDYGYYLILDKNIAF
jgi:hypothetical protein